MERKMYRAKKSEALHELLVSWQLENRYAIQYYHVNARRFEWIDDSFLEFDINRRGLAELKRQGFAVQKRQIFWQEIKRCQSITYYEHLFFMWTSDFCAIVEKNKVLKFVADLAALSFIHNVTEFRLPVWKNLSGKILEFSTRKKQVINGLIRKGYRIKRKKITWKDI